MVNAQKTCDRMVREAEEKCAQMLSDANAAASSNAKNADALIAAENARVEEARRVAAAKIQELQDQIHACIHALDRIKEANRPAANYKSASAFDYDRTEAASSQNNKADAMADEISANLEALVGTTEDNAPKAEPKHPTSEMTTSKFANLQFGRNYDPTNR